MYALVLIKLYFKHNIEVENTKDQTSTWKKIENFEGVQGVWLDGEWVALIDLEREENTGEKTTIE